MLAQLPLSPTGRGGSDGYPAPMGRGHGDHTPGRQGHGGRVAGVGSGRLGWLLVRLAHWGNNTPCFLLAQVRNLLTV